MPINRNKTKTRRTILLFLLPALVIYIGLAVIPILQSIWFSFFEWNGVSGSPLTFVGFRNFVTIFRSEAFYHALKNAFVFALLNLVIQIPLGYFLAYLLSDFCRGYRWFKAVFFASVILPMTATALLFKLIFGSSNTGALNTILISLGLIEKPQGWLIQESTALLFVILANAWCGFGYHMTLGFAAITDIPTEILQVAELDGATGLRKIVSIVIPMIWESLKISIVMIITGSIKIFDIIYIMTEGGPNGMTQVPAVMMYNEAFKYNHYGTGSAISVVIFILCIGLSVMSLKLMNRKSE